MLIIAIECFRELRISLSELKQTQIICQLNKRISRHISRLHQSKSFPSRLSERLTNDRNVTTHSFFRSASCRCSCCCHAASAFTLAYPINQYWFFEWIRRSCRNLSEWCGKACFRGASTIDGREVDIIAKFHVQSAGAALLYHQTTFAFNRLHDRSRSTIFVRALNHKRFIVPSKSVTLAVGATNKSSRFACKQNRRVTKARSCSRRQTKSLKRHCRPARKQPAAARMEKRCLRENQFLLGAWSLKCH